MAALAVKLNEEAWGENHPDTISSIGTWASALTSLGRATEGEPLAAKALRLTREVHGEYDLYSGLALERYATVLIALGRQKEALPLLREAVATVMAYRRNTFDPLRLEYLFKYATLLRQNGRVEESETILRDLLERQNSAVGSQSKAAMDSLHAYALTLQKIGRISEAEKHFLDVLEKRRRVLGEYHPDTHDSLIDYAVLLSSQGRLSEAEPLLEEALNKRPRALGARHPRTLDALDLYALTLLRSGQAAKALLSSRKLVTAGRERARRLSGGSTRGESQIARELTEVRTRERLHVDILLANSDMHIPGAGSLGLEAFHTLQSASSGSTSYAVAEAAASRFAKALGFERTVKERQTLTSLWKSLEKALIGSFQIAGDSEGKRYREELGRKMEETSKRIEQLDAILSAEVPRYFSIRSPDPVEISELRAILKPDEAVLILVPSKNGTHSMAVSSDQIEWRRADNLPLEDLNSLIPDFRLGLEVTDETGLKLFDLGTAHRLYHELIAPVEDALEGKSRVYVVADGPLSRVPLGVLVTSPPAGDDFSDDDATLRATPWLSDRYALVQLPSVQSLVYVRKFGVEGRSLDQKGRSNFSGFGAPVLDGKARSRGARSPTIGPQDAATLVSNLDKALDKPLMDPQALRRLAALPGTRTELEQVSEALGASKSALYLADRMTEPAIRSADLSGTRILHLATHGFTSEESGKRAEPGLVFTPPKEAQNDNDGYLAASEVVALDLTSAEWVILSACNTASPSGSLGEAGLSGLAQAFLYAGAETLLVSHWPVFDHIAPILTVEALKRSKQGQPRAEALQSAMRDARMDPKLNAAHPAVWAPFSLVGEGF